MKIGRNDRALTGNTAYLLTALIIIIIIFASVAVVMLDSNPVENGQLELSIALDKTTFGQGEDFLVHLFLTNNNNEPVNISEYWFGGTLFINLYNSTGEELTSEIWSISMSMIPMTELPPQGVYHDDLNLSDYYQGELWFDSYTINATYINYHGSGMYLAQNSSRYRSNSIGFTVGWPENYPALAAFQPIGEDELPIFCEVADTSAERAQGLMDRTEMQSGYGMLFIFDSPRDVSFWMKNTLIPLDIIFIDENGFVANIAEADPEPGVSDADLTRYPSDGPILYVIEINQGLAVANGIHSGTYVNLTYMP